MGLESSALSTITGEVNRAYLLVRKEVVREENRKSGGIAGLTDDLNIGSTVAGMSELYDSLNSVSSQMNGINSLLGVEQNIYRVANSKGYMPIKVQYNPSSIVYAGLKGTQGIGEHDGAFIEHDRPVETTMGMELIFDSLDLNLIPSTLPSTRQAFAILRSFDPLRISMIRSITLQALIKPS